MTATLPAVADPGADYAADDGAIGSQKVREDDGHRDAIGHAKGNHAMLTVVAPRVVELDIRTAEYQRSKAKSKSKSRWARFASLFAGSQSKVNDKLHVYIQAVKRVREHGQQVPVA